MIAIVAYGMGNIQSVVNAFEHLGHKVMVARTPAEIESADKILLPGVGAFRAAMERLESGGFRPALDEAVLVKRKPVLGICLGMQLLAETGTEGGDVRGLGWIPGQVEIIPRGARRLRLPHVGWNDIEAQGACPLLAGLDGDRAFYFVHSYHLVAAEPADVAGITDYGGPVTAAVWRGHVFGLQPHPEKSMGPGLKVLDAFAKL